MSKSFGNVVDPLDWIERFGADATRFTLARGANPGADVPVSEEWTQGSRNFCNKLWNATRFALMNGARTDGPLPPAERLSTVDRWVLSRLQHVVQEVDEQFERYEFAKICDTLYHFAWDDVCDWYLELTKPVIGADQNTQRVLGHVLDQVLRLLHPIIPFVTEELWLALNGLTGEADRDRSVDGPASIVIAEWPAPDKSYLDDAAEVEITSLQKVVTEVRRFRSDQGLKPGQRVAARLSGLPALGLAPHEPLIRALVRLDEDGGDFTATATLPITGGVTVELDTRGAIDVAAERARLEKDRAAAEKERAGAEAKLSTAEFLAKATELVVAKIKGRLAAAEAELARTNAALVALAGTGVTTGQPGVQS
jgi:valyl-tRNA synthetase